jgi:hypothetical protein
MDMLTLNESGHELLLALARISKATVTSARSSRDLAIASHARSVQAPSDALRRNVIPASVRDI